MSVVYLRVICLFVFIWKASAKTNKGEKNYLAASETKLVENILLCLSKIITLILLQSSTTFWAERENSAGRLFWCHDVLFAILEEICSIPSFNMYFLRLVRDLLPKSLRISSHREDQMFPHQWEELYWLTTTLLLLSVRDGWDKKCQTWGLFLQCPPCPQEGHWGSGKVRVSGVEVHSVGWKERQPEMREGTQCCQLWLHG